MAAKKASDDVEETQASDPVMPAPWTPDPVLARIQQEQYLLVTYVDLAIKSEQIIGGEETATRVRAGLDRLKAMADSMATG